MAVGHARDFEQLRQVVVVSALTVISSRSSIDALRQLRPDLDWYLVSAFSPSVRMLLALLISICSLMLAPVANGSHTYGTYGGRGLVFFAIHRDQALAWTTSTTCSPREREAYNRIVASTVNQYPVRWPSGIRMSRDPEHSCDGKVTRYVDIKLAYRAPSDFVRADGSTYSGYNVSWQAY